jgi:hypothetical protein
LSSGFLKGKKKRGALAPRRLIYPNISISPELVDIAIRINVVEQVIRQGSTLIAAPDVIGRL